METLKEQILTRLNDSFQAMVDDEIPQLLNEILQEGLPTEVSEENPLVAIYAANIKLTTALMTRLCGIMMESVAEELAQLQPGNTTPPVNAFATGLKK
jgi:hypothetical protein